MKITASVSTLGDRLLPAIAVGLALGLTPAAATVNTQNPVSGPAQTNAIPPLPATGGFFFQPPVNLTSSIVVHEGSYSWAPDLDSPPLQTPADGAICQDLLVQVMPQQLFTAVTAAFPFHLADALAESNTTVAQLDTGGLGDFVDAVSTFLDVLSVLPGAEVPDLVVGNTQDRCVAYPALHGRWLANQWAQPSPNTAETLYTYSSDPRAFRELRERGARLYCAARAAQFLQGDEGFSMGARPGFSVDVLGRQIDFFVTEPSLVFDGPERFTGLGANDGAQAFEVPLLFGTRITPIRGLGLPGFREVRVPVSLVTADSEVRNDAEFRNILISKNPPVLIEDHSKTYHTVTHLDAIHSATKRASLGSDEDPAQIELFRVGPLAVKLGFFVAYEVGAFDASDDRIASFPGFPTARTGRLWGQSATGRLLHDGAWTPRFSGPGARVNSTAEHGLFWVVLGPDGLPEGPFWTEPVDLVFPPPLDIRLLQDDDHSIASATTLVLGGKVSGTLGGGFGPFKVDLEVTGGVTGRVTQTILLRDALVAQDQGLARMTPITGLGVRGRQEGEAELAKTTGKVHLFLDLPGPFLDDIKIVKTLFTVDAVPLAQYDSDKELPKTSADDDPNFRLGTGSAQGKVMKQPTVFSHFPGSTSEFASFAVDVDACLADPTDNPETPQPCDETVATGQVPQKELCVWGPSNLLETVFSQTLPPHVCTNIAGYVAGLGHPPAQASCLNRYLGFLCSPVSKQQASSGYSDVVSHVLDLFDGVELAAFEGMLKVCAAAYGTAVPDGIIGATGVAEQFLEFGVCDADGTIRNGEEILGSVNPTQTPSVETGAPCH